MGADSSLSQVFDRLKPILEKYAASLNCTKNAADHYYLETTHLMQNNKPLFFASLQIKKSFVSFHLMPVYSHPALLDAVPPELRKRMQGKSCFNFKSVNTVLFNQLETLVAKSVKCYQALGYI